MLQHIALPARAPSQGRALPKPFIKWVGGKGQLIPQIWPLLPEKFNSYHEPFMGGGALFFALAPTYATLSDINAELVDCYAAIRDHALDVIQALKEHPYERDHFYKVRTWKPSDLPLVERAARTIYLNRAGFNGLYRVNKQGIFNVPFGRYKNPQICNTENILACARALRHVKVVHRDFHRILETARPGDLVYFDPPYVPVSKTSDFTAYSADGFTMEDQVRLADVFSRLADRGVHCLLSNSDTAFVRQLYKDFEIDVVSASRAINANAAKRGRINEVVVRSYPRREQLELS